MVDAHRFVPPEISSSNKQGLHTSLESFVDAEFLTTTGNPTSEIRGNNLIRHVRKSIAMPTLVAQRHLVIGEFGWALRINTFLEMPFRL